MAALNLFVARICHAIITEIVEAEFGVRSVSDVAAVLLSPEGGRKLVLDGSDGESEEFKDGTHPFRVPAGEVVVYGDDMNS